MEEINAARVELDPWASAPDEVVVPDPDWSTPTTIGGSGSRYTSTATSPTDAVQRGAPVWTLRAQALAIRAFRGSLTDPLYGWAPFCEEVFNRVSTQTTEHPCRSPTYR